MMSGGSAMDAMASEGGKKSRRKYRGGNDGGLLGNTLQSIDAKLSGASTGGGRRRRRSRCGQRGGLSDNGANAIADAGINIAKALGAPTSQGGGHRRRSRKTRSRSRKSRRTRRMSGGVVLLGGKKSRGRSRRRY
jgi:hypothetical protein